MGCARCGERRQDLGAAAQAAASGDVKLALEKIGHVGRTLGEDAAAVTRIAAQRLASAHQRLKR